MHQLRDMRFLLSCGLAICLSNPSSCAQSMQSHSTGESETVVGYDQVREVIRKRCATCHNPDEMRGDLDLSTLTALRAGATSGPVAVAGKPNQSMLYKSAAHLDDPVMPPNSPKIPGRELDLIRRWIEGGLAEKSGPRSEISVEIPSEISIASSDSEVKPTSSHASGLVAARAMLHSTAIAALDAHPKQNIVAVSGNQQAVLLDVATGKWLGAFDFPEGEVTALRFSRDGRLLVVAGGVAGLSGRVVAFDVATGKRMFQLADENDTILSVDLSPDGSMLALGGPAKVVRIFSVASGEVLHTLRKHTDWVLAVRFSPDGLLLASGDRFGGLFVWEPQRGAEFHTLRGHTGAINTIVWDQNSETLVSGGEDGRIRTWNMHHGELTSQWAAGVGAILSLDSNGTLVACGGRNKNTIVWNGPEQKLGEHLDNDQIERVAIAANGKSLVSADATGNIRLLDMQTAQERLSLSLPVDDTQIQVVFKRMEDARAEYARRLYAKPDTVPVVQASETVPLSEFVANSSMASMILAMKSEIETSRQNAALLRYKAAEIAESLAATAKLMQELQQAQSALQAHLDKQDLHITAAEKHSAAFEATLLKMLASNPQLSTEVAKQQQQALEVKLARHQKLLATSLQMLDQLSASTDPASVDADLGKTRKMVLELSNELQQRVDDVTTRIDSIDGKADTEPVTRTSLVDAEQ